MLSSSNNNQTSPHSSHLLPTVPIKPMHISARRSRPATSSWLDLVLLRLLLDWNIEVLNKSDVFAKKTVHIGLRLTTQALFGTGLASRFTSKSKKHPPNASQRTGVRGSPPTQIAGLWTGRRKIANTASEPLLLNAAERFKVTETNRPSKWIFSLLLASSFHVP
jgi:hypothetical protein